MIPSVASLNAAGRGGVCGTVSLAGAAPPGSPAAANWCTAVTVTAAQQQMTTAWGRAFQAA